MSLILEALKKLERERDASGRGFLVVAHTPWAATRGRAARVAVVALAAGALGGAWGAWTWSSSHGRAPVTTPASAPAVTRGLASPLPPPIWEAAPAAQAPAVAAASPAAPKPSGAPPTAAPSAQSEEPPLQVISSREAPRATAVPLRLEAISSQDGEPVAVINGQLVRKGETIEGALVTWIGADSVEIEIGGRRRVLGF